ncbi:MAG: tripartite tricarboxylate transporter TctB family protein [Synergistaceae bacterium]|nr:tripartite tricarboxylate transporter TctB family protein [Synergistaceae bacterium]
MFKREDWIFGLTSLALGIGVLLYAETLEAATMNAVTSMDPSGPAALPRIVGWLMLVIGAAHVAGSYLLIKKNPNPKPKKKGGSARVIGICIACGAYYFLLEPLGYLLTTPCLIIAIMMSVGERNALRILGTSIGASAVLFCVFQYLLGVNMPLGPLSGLLG